MTGNLIEKYFEYRIKNLVAYATSLLEIGFENKFTWQKQLSQCSEYYFKNYIMISNYNLRPIIKYRRFFDQNKINDKKLQIVFVSIFESMIDYKYLKEEEVQNIVLLIGKCIYVATIIDEEINTFSNVKTDFSDIYNILINYFNKDNIILEVLDKCKKQLQLLINGNLDHKRKFDKFINNQNFQLELIPLIRKNGNKQIYEVIPKYDIKTLNKFKNSEVDYVYTSSDIDIELVFIAYTYVCSMIIKTLELKKRELYIIKLNSKFFKKKKYATKLVGLMSKNGFCNYIIFEIDGQLVDKHYESIRTIQNMGGLILITSISGRAPKVKPNYLEINEEDYAKADLFTKYGKEGKTIILSNVLDENYQKFIDYRRRKTD